MALTLEINIVRLNTMPRSATYDTSAQFSHMHIQTFNFYSHTYTHTKKNSPAVVAPHGHPMRRGQS